MCDAIAPLNT